MKVGDLVLYTPDEEPNLRVRGSKPDVGVVLKLSPSGTKASVLWSEERVGVYFAVADLDAFPDNFKLVPR